MSVSELLYEAGILMMVGMIVVFLFLSLLIFATKLLSKFASSVSSSPSLKPAPQATAINAPQPIVAAISAAIQKYKQDQK